MMRAEEHTPLLGRKKPEGGRRRSRSRSRPRSRDRATERMDNPRETAQADDEANAADDLENNHYFKDPPYLDRISTIEPQQSRRRPRQASSTARGRGEDGGLYSGGVGTFDQLDLDNVPTPPRNGTAKSKHNNQKADRRSFFQRAKQFVRQNMIILPPLPGYRSLDPSADAAEIEPWKCSLGTRESDGTWLNYTDQGGTAMAFLVWILVGYCGGTMLVLARHGHIPPEVAALQCTLSLLIWACHAKTMLTDPGTIPSTAVPLVTKGVKFHTMCSVCQSYKPLCTHHCRICNRCISRMDHHCPWMNNCVGAANLKHFTLFLFYAWMGSATALFIFGWNYFFCGNENCEFQGLEIQLVRAMSLICFVTLMFTSSMLMNVIYGIMTGTGTIDRLKQKADNTWHMSDQQATPLTHIWGTGSIWGWWLPIDPVWDDFGKLMGYATTQQLLQQSSADSNI